MVPEAKLIASAWTADPDAAAAFAVAAAAAALMYTIVCHYTAALRYRRAMLTRLYVADTRLSIPSVYRYHRPPHPPPCLGRCPTLLPTLSWCAIYRVRYSDITSSPSLLTFKQRLKCTYFVSPIPVSPSRCTDCKLCSLCGPWSSCSMLRSR